MYPNARHRKSAAPYQGQKFEGEQGVRCGALLQQEGEEKLGYTIERDRVDKDYPGLFALATTSCLRMLRKGFFLMFPSPSSRQQNRGVRGSETPGSQPRTGMHSVPRWSCIAVGLQQTPQDLPLQPSWV